MDTTHQPPRILIVDDKPLGVELLEAYLAETDYDTRAAADGEAALRVIHEWQPDIILLDIMMPKLSGFEVCKRVKADPATKGISVVMVTALDQPSDLERAVEVGTNDFLTKPINKTELLLRIKAMLATRSSDELASTVDYINAVQAATV